MKNVLFLMLFLLLISCKEQRNKIDSSLQVIVKYTNAPVIIDGVLDDDIWKKTRILELKENISTFQVSDSTKYTFVRVCYDSAYLYISFECRDQDIWGTFIKRDQHLWEEEAVEVFIDVDDKKNDYFEIEISPKNVLFDSFIIDPYNIDIPATSDFDFQSINSAVSVNGTIDERNDTDSLWTVEIKISLGELLAEYDPKSLSKFNWKINFYRINRDGKNEPENFAWSPTGGRFHNPSVFGTLVFE